MVKKLGTGFELNNPGHIERGNSKWLGLAPVQKHPRFATFVDAVYGIRAIAVTLMTYQDKYGIRTILDAIKRYAPPSDNNPSTRYAQFVAARAGLDTGGIINFHDYRYLRGIVEGMIAFELGGQPYTPAQLDKGLALAGVLAPQRSLAASGTVQAGTVATASTAGVGVAETIQQAADQVSVLTPYLEIAKYAFLGLTIAAVLYMVYRRWDDHRRLAR